MPNSTIPGGFAAIVCHPDPLHRAVLTQRLTAAGANQVQAYDSLLRAMPVNASGPTLVVVAVDSALDRELDGCVTAHRDDRARYVAVVSAQAASAIPAFFCKDFCAFVDPDADAAAFRIVARSAFEGGVYFSRAALQALLAVKRDDQQILAALGLTAREKQVLALIAINLSNKDIARKLALSVRTVETHRFNIRKKTNAGNWRELAEIADRMGLLGDYRFAVQLAERIGAPSLHEDERR